MLVTNWQNSRKQLLPINWILYTKRKQDRFDADFKAAYNELLCGI